MKKLSVLPPSNHFTVEQALDYVKHMDASQVLIIVYDEKTNKIKLEYDKTMSCERTLWLLENAKLITLDIIDD